MFQTDFVVYARVVHEGIKAAKLLNCRPDCILAICRGRQIRDDHVTCAYFAVKVLAGLGVMVHNDGNRSLRSAGSHDCGANAFGSAGDQNYLIFKLQIHSSLAISRANS
jgi:hypothetical protein